MNNIGSCMILGALTCYFVPAVVLGQQSGSSKPGELAQGLRRITPNFKDADINLIAEAVSAATGKTFIIDPHVRAQVTMISSSALSPDAFYQAFLSILAVYSFVAVADGNVVKIIPDANAKQTPSVDLPDRVSDTSDEFVTQVIDVKNVNATQLVPILRPMLAQSAHLAAYPAGNVLIISDRANNVNRMIRIIRRIDQVSDQDVEILPLQNAAASEVVRVLNSLYQGAAAGNEAGAAPVKIVADDRSDSVLVSGDPDQRLRVRAVVAQLDTQMTSDGGTRVRYLYYANADKIAPKLKEQMTGIAQQPGAGASGAPQAQAEKNAMIWADPANNALVITAPPKIMSQIMAIVDKLDVRRPQVLVETIIADVDITKDGELGVNWAAYGKGSNIPAAAFVSPVGGTSIVDLAGAIQNPSSVSSTLLNGTTAGIGRIGSGAVNFAAVLRAIQSDSHSNIIATPSAVTMDAQEAVLKSGQEVPFVTGQFSNTGTSTNGAVNPFQTVQREDVGTTLKVTPTISPEGTAIALKLSVENSNIAPTPKGAVDLVTSKRTVTTNVLVDDGGMVVIGGLTRNTSNRQESRIPLLGSIPIIGQAFKTRSNTTEKETLMIFIRPKILRDPAQAAYETELKYNYMQDEQKSSLRREIPPLLPGEHEPRLPPLPGTDTGGASEGH